VLNYIPATQKKVILVYGWELYIHKIELAI